jgi:uncharacterized protein (TIGR02118 family)
MIKVYVLYPEGGAFNFDYYVSSHMKMVGELLTPMGMTDAVATKGLGGLEPGSKPANVCIAELTFKDMESFQKSMAAHGDKLMADLPNFTKIQPVMQINEVL